MACVVIIHKSKQNILGCIRLVLCNPLNPSNILNAHISDSSSTWSRNHLIAVCFESVNASSLDHSLHLHSRFLALLAVSEEQPNPVSHFCSVPVQMVNSGNPFFPPSVKYYQTKLTLEL